MQCEIRFEIRDAGYEIRDHAPHRGSRNRHHVPVLGFMFQVSLFEFRICLNLGKKIMHRFVAMAGVLVLITLAGCSSSPASRFYTLSAVAPPAGASSNVSVVVGPVSVPAEVDRPQIVITTGPNQVGLDEFNRWAAPLQNNISRVVVENLVAMLGTPRVTLFPQTASPDADYRAAIEVQRFESAPGDAATLDAVWTVIRSKDGKSQMGRTTVRDAVQEKNYGAL